MHTLRPTPPQAGEAADKIVRQKGDLVWKLHHLRADLYTISSNTAAGWKCLMFRDYGDKKGQWATLWLPLLARHRTPQQASVARALVELLRPTGTGTAGQCGTRPNVSLVLSSGHHGRHRSKSEWHAL